MQLHIMSNEGRGPTAARVTAVASLYSGTDVTGGDVRAVLMVACLTGSTDRLDAANCAVQHRFDDDTIADFCIPHFVTGLDHSADDFVAEGERKRSDWREKRATLGCDGRQIAAADATKQRLDARPVCVGQLRFAHVTHSGQRDAAGVEPRKALTDAL